MVVPEGESLNTLFETLADWESQLKDCGDLIPREVREAPVEPTP